MSTFFFSLKPNASGEPRPEAGAQRTLEGVGSSAWFGGFPGGALPRAQWYKELYPRRAACWGKAFPAFVSAERCSISAITWSIDDTCAKHIEVRLGVTRSD